MYYFCLNINLIFFAMNKFCFLIIVVISMIGMISGCGNRSVSDGNNDVADTDVLTKENAVAESLTEHDTHSDHDWVDLGLPSGTLWAVCNIGASTQYDYGTYFAWGETSIKDSYSWENYKYGKRISQEDDGVRLNKYCSISKYGDNGFSDKLTTLNPSDDAATVNWGKDWRTPTPTEFEELEKECKWEWCSYFEDTPREGDTIGYRVIGPNGKSIFFPAAGLGFGPEELIDPIGGGFQGYYWTNSILTEKPTLAKFFGFDSDMYFSFSVEDFYYIENFYRACGLSVRPVYVPQK